MVDGWDRHENKGSSYTAVPTRISFINIGTPKIIKLYVFMSVNQINLLIASKCLFQALRHSIFPTRVRLKKLIQTIKTIAGSGRV